MKIQERLLTAYIIDWTVERRQYHHFVNMTKFLLPNSGRINGVA